MRTTVAPLPLPERGSREWLDAAQAAFRHPSGLLCFKGTLPDGFPGYVDERHPLDMAIADEQILRRMLREHRYHNRNAHQMMTATYRIHLKHWRDARRQPALFWQMDILYLEPMRAQYHADTGKAFLPLKPYYARDTADIDDAKHVLPISTHDMFAQLMTWEQGKRLKRMDEQRGQFIEWLQHTQQGSGYGVHIQQLLES